MKKFFFQKYTCFIFLIVASMFLSGCFNKQKLHMQNEGGNELGIENEGRNALDVENKANTDTVREIIKSILEEQNKDANLLQVQERLNIIDLSILNDGVRVSNNILSGNIMYPTKEFAYLIHVLIFKCSYIIDMERDRNNLLYKACANLLITLLNNENVNVNVVQDKWQGTILHHIISTRDWNLLRNVLEIERIRNTFHFQERDGNGETCREKFLTEYDGDFNIGDLLLNSLQLFEEAELIDNLIFSLTKNNKIYSFGCIAYFTRQRENDFFERENGTNIIKLLNICKHDENNKRISRIYDALELQPNAMIANLPLLIWAARANHFQLAHFLIVEKKADVNLRDNNGMTTLICATRIGNLDIVRLLVEREGIDINLQDNDGMTALITAVCRGNNNIVQLLVEREGIDINLRDNDGMTALIIVARWGDRNMVRLLVKRKEININLRDNYGKTALMWAREQNHIDIVQCLSSRRNTNRCTLL